MTVHDYYKRRKAKEHAKALFASLVTAAVAAGTAWGLFKSSDSSAASTPKEEDRVPEPKIVHRQEAPKQWVRHEVEEEEIEENHQVDTIHHVEEAYEEEAPAPTQVRIIKRTVQTNSGAREYYENVPPPQPVIIQQEAPAPQPVIIQQEAPAPQPVVINQGPSAAEIVAANIATHAAGAIIHDMTHHHYHGGHSYYYGPNAQVAE